MAAVFLAAAYAAVGLYISSKTDSQIVSLILSVLSGGCFLCGGVGSPDRVCGKSGFRTFKLLGTGSRFESITRGVLDIRDIYYYVSLSAVFLAFNTFALGNAPLVQRKGAPFPQGGALDHGAVVRQFFGGQPVVETRERSPGRHDPGKRLFHFTRHERGVVPTAGTAC
jgi:hypothetical protein